MKHGNYVAQFSFPKLDIVPTKAKFIERLEDDYIIRQPRTEQSSTKGTDGYRNGTVQIAPGMRVEESKPTQSITAQESEKQKSFTFGPRI